MCLGQTRNFVPNSTPAAIAQLTTFKRKISDLLNETQQPSSGVKDLPVQVPPTKKSRNKKHVRFLEGCQPREISTGMTEPDLALVWYQRADYAAFRKDSREIIRYLTDMTNALVKPSHCSFRGLEILLSSSRRRASFLRKKASMLLILRQQKRQRQQGIVDTEELRRISLIVSKGGLDEALSMAAVDAMVAKQNSS